MSDTLEIEVAGNDQTTILRVRGRVDARTSTILVGRCDAVRESGRNLVLNLSGVSFLSSSGIGALLALTEEFREAGRHVLVVQPDATVRDAIELLNLHEFIDIRDSEDEALGEQAA
jgi:anti-sigma B factor antagonist